jgi:hypothetical protein
MKPMRIECPSCGAEYNVPDRLLAGPRGCGAARRIPVAADAPRCEPEPEPEPPPPPAAEPAPPAAAPDPAAPDERRLKLAWAASVLVVLGALATFLLARESVMAAWPASTRLFATLGLV